MGDLGDQEGVMNELIRGMKTSEQEVGPAEREKERERERERVRVSAFRGAVYRQPLG